MLGALAEPPRSVGTASPFRLAGSGLRWWCQGENSRRSSARSNQFQNTKSTELIFSVLLSEDGARNVRFQLARAELSIPVWVHQSDVPLTKRPWLYMSERSPFAYLGRKPLPIVASFVRAGAPRVGPIREVRRFGDEGTLDLPGSPRVLFTPGHTLGHVALHLPERDAVITGDSLVTHDIYTDIRGPRIVARGATADSERALASLDRLAGTGAGTLLPGHGEPWTDGAEQAVKEARRASSGLRRTVAGLADDTKITTIFRC